MKIDILLNPPLPNFHISKGRFLSRSRLQLTKLSSFLEKEMHTRVSSKPLKVNYLSLSASFFSSIVIPSSFLSSLSPVPGTDWEKILIFEFQIFCEKRIGREILVVVLFNFDHWDIRCHPMYLLKRVFTEFWKIFCTKLEMRIKWREMRVTRGRILLKFKIEGACSVKYEIWNLQSRHNLWRTWKTSASE